MPELEKRNDALDNQPENTAEDYIQAINELKAKSVDRSKYDELKAENKRLLESIVNGQEIDLPKEEDKPNIDELRKKLFNSDDGLTNLDYVNTALQLRNALIENGEVDPFVPNGHQISPTEEDLATAQKVATIFQECVDYAEGDPLVFANELARRTQDSRLR